MAVPVESRIDRQLGIALKERRLRNNLTIAEIAGRSGISRGMLSKIENGQAAASLDSLGRIAKSLGVRLSSLFAQFDAPRGGAQHIKAGAGMEVVRRGTRRGHTYHLLAYDQGPKKLFEPFLVTMDDQSEVFPTFQHPGTEFLHLLTGRIEYRHGDSRFVMQPGDSLTFAGDVPHGPVRLIKVPIRLLSIIYYGDQPV